MAEKEIKVGIGDMKFIRGEGRIITYALGSCIGVTFYDPFLRLGALLHILIPLSAAASRGDQILNANSFAKQGFSAVLEEEALTGESLLQAINETHKNRRAFIDKMAESHLNNAVSTIIELINECCND